MRTLRPSISAQAALWAGCFVLLASPAWGQLNLDFGKALGPSGAGSAKKAQVSAQFTAPQGGQPAILSITAKLAPGCYTYSLTQEKPPKKTVIKLPEPQQYKFLSGFQADHPPKFGFDPAFKNVRLEKHLGTVTFFAPFELNAGAKLDELSISGQLDLQVCDDRSCETMELPFTARLSEQVVIPPEALAGGEPAAQGVQEYRKANSAVSWTGVLEPAQVTPGSKALLKLTAHPDPAFHIYAFGPQFNPNNIGLGRPTLIALDNTSGLQTYQARTEAEIKEEKTPDGEVNRIHHGAVTWTVEIDVPPKTPAGTYPITGLIGYQVCTNSSCQQPTATRFQTELKIGPTADAVPANVTFMPAEYTAAAEAASKYHPLLAMGAGPPVDLMTLLWVFPLAFLGGVILNLMPCVLPVVGLKILSLVDQAGHNRREALQLNLAFTAGVLVIFLALATLSVAVNLSWGQQFQSATFSIILTAVLFVFALSFLGVWEIPLPGFVGSGKATHAASKEGYAGAFFKGALSTIVATPCSGPALGAVFALTLSLHPVVTYLLFLTIGLGMASPYLIVGAFPSLVRWLPKPGAWMDTFKQVSGFIMLAAVVVMFKFYINDETLVVPTLGLLIGLWFGCWWIGRTPLYEPTPKVLKAWAIGLLLAAVCGGGGFRLLMPRADILPWQKFSQERLAELRKEGKVVMVDFTANWCLTCQYNTVAAIDTKKTLEAVEQYGVVPLLADWTDESTEIKNVLNAWGSNSIPFLVIFPADPALEPIKLRDVVTQQQVLDKLHEAAGAPQTAGGAAPGTDTTSSQDRSQQSAESNIPWETFSQQRLDELTSQGKTVMVEFTADWDLSTAYNHVAVIDTKPVGNALKQHDIVPLLADWTDESPEIKQALNTLGSNSIPLVAIFPADRSDKPIILRDLMTQQQVISALQEAATPSTAAAVPSSTAAKMAGN